MIKLRITNSPKQKLEGKSQLEYVWEWILCLIKLEHSGRSSFVSCYMYNSIFNFPRGIICAQNRFTCVLRVNFRCSADRVNFNKFYNYFSWSSANLSALLRVEVQFLLVRTVCLRIFFWGFLPDNLVTLHRNHEKSSDWKVTRLSHAGKPTVV